MDDSPVYTFELQLKEHAQVIGLLVRERYRSGVWRVMRWLVVVVLVLGAVGAVTNVLLGDLSSSIRLGLLVLIVGGMTFWFEKWAGLIRAWQVRRIDPATQFPISHAIDPAGIRVFTRVAETTLKWDGLYEVRETPDLFLFYYSKRIAYYLPKRVVGGQPEVEALRTLILKRLSSEIPFQEG